MVTLDMLESDALASELVAKTNLTYKQIYYRLRLIENKGYSIKRKYYSDGEISYKLNTDFAGSNKATLYTKAEENQIKMVLISDLHLGSLYDRIDLLKEIYNFCLKNNIHIIINAGDLIDGFMGLPEKRVYGEEQVEYILKNYPFDPSILNFITLGNHDEDYYLKTYQDIHKILNNKRHDLISLGYGLGKLKIKQDEIVVKHKTINKIGEEDIRNTLYIAGDAHKFRINIENTTSRIILPSLSDLKTCESSYPGFICANLSFSSGIISHVFLEQYIFEEKLAKVNEMSLNINSKVKHDSLYEYKRVLKK